ncbi:MAG TPA: putative DNA modification/repair radical SAM protein [Gemmatimonadaceae bacterium]|nr:putative DNA modification/repair radical SAM protein [Gemmatimonadaceae bacterium]
MNIDEKLSILADAAKYDASCASSGSRGRRAGPGGIGSTDGMGICHSYTPDGRCVSLLKLLLTNYCIYDCAYCINRRSSGVRRARFTPDDVVWLTLEFYRRNYIEGLFLSSGIIRDSDYTMEQLIAVARTLRQQHGFGGYIHLKTIPNAAPELILEAGRWADRLSINVELPRQSDLDSLAPEKELTQITRAMGVIRDGIAESRADATPRTSNVRPATNATAASHGFAPAGQATQMIVGATDASDSVILSTAASLYKGQRLRRVYFSAFSPIPDAASLLPSIAPPLVREHRLYQADWLMRFYGFKAPELTTPDAPNLDLAIDPKLAWALRNRDRFPLDLNVADKADLLRIPGIGARSVERILSVRRWRQLRLEDLGRLRIALDRALPFIVVADHSPRGLPDALDLRQRITDRSQLDLFAVGRSAHTGQL